MKVVVYEGWQMECCGNPFKVGDAVKWSVIEPANPGYLADIGIATVDFFEEHHHDTTERQLLLSGTVSSIRLLYFTYMPHGNTLIPSKPMLVDARDTEQSHKDIGDYRFSAYVVEISDNNNPIK